MFITLSHQLLFQDPHLECFKHAIFCSKPNTSTIEFPSATQNQRIRDENNNADTGVIVKAQGILPNRLECLSMDTWINTYPWVNTWINTYPWVITWIKYLIIKIIKLLVSTTVLEGTQVLN